MIRETSKQKKINRKSITKHAYDEHTLTQCIGGYAIKKIIPFTKQYKLKSGDSLLLCSDGLTDMLDYNQIFSIINRYFGLKTDTKNVMRYYLQSICKDLNEKAIKSGGLDNITAIIIKKIH